VTTGQPANQTVPVGATATFTVAASNATSIRWEISTNAGASFNTISGAIGPSYTTPPTTAAMNGYRYQAVLSNACSQRTTDAATLTVTVVGNGGGLQYYALPTPKRLLDTRGAGACVITGGQLAAKEVRPQTTRSTCSGVPQNAVAITGNATIFGPSGAGYITLYPSNADRPTVSNLNYDTNQTAPVPNSFTVRLGSDGAFNIYAEAPTHFIVDITGYYAPPGEGGMYFYPLPAPVRLLDTRPDPSCIPNNTPLSGGGTLVVKTGDCGSANIPASAKAVVGNATAVNSRSQGYVTLFPEGQPPLASNLNFDPGRNVPNAFVVGLNSGSFSIYASGASDIIIDIAGYFSDQAVENNRPGLLFYPLSAPARWLDTRPNEQPCVAPNAPITTNGIFKLQTQFTCKGQTIPTNARSVLGNATVVNPSGNGYITLYPADVAQPFVSNLNYDANQTAPVPNSFIVGLGADGAFNIYANALTHFIIDLSGYFAPPQ
jgi:hypothetical protein